MRPVLRSLLFVLAAGAASAQEPREFTVYYGFERAPLDEAAIAVVTAAARAALDGDAPLVAITGHTDAAGDAEANLALARLRAEIVRDELAARGVPPAALRVDAVGEADPAVVAPTGAREAANRRVVVVVSEPGSTQPRAADAPFAFPLPRQMRDGPAPSETPDT